MSLNEVSFWDTRLITCIFSSVLEGLELNKIWKKEMFLSEIKCVNK